MRLLNLTTVALVLTACGGGSNDETYQRAVELADAKETEARALVVDTPCVASSQCGYLTFQSPQGSCGGWRYKPYSLAATWAAAASAAATEQNVLAGQAIALAPASNVVCPAIVAPPPIVVCVVSVCQAS